MCFADFPSILHIHIQNDVVHFFFSDQSLESDKLKNRNRVETKSFRTMIRKCQITQRGYQCEKCTKECAFSKSAIAKKGQVDAGA